MASVYSSETIDDVTDIAESLKQLSVARAQINSLRYVVGTCTIQVLIVVIFFIRKQNESLKKQLNEKDLMVSNGPSTASSSEKIELSIIGTIKTKFKERRCVPRQPGLCPLAQACLTISNSIFTNPNHALEGLSDFSHMW